MRNALIRLAPCAVFLSLIASAQTVERVETNAGNPSSAVPITGPGVNAPGSLSGATLSGPGLQTGLQPNVAPVLTQGAAAAAVNPLNVAPVTGAALPIQNLGFNAAAKLDPKSGLPLKTPAATPKTPVTNSVATPGSEKLDAPGVKGPPSASSTLDTAARGIADGRKEEAAGGDAQSVRRALDHAYDSSMRGGDVGGGSGVAGKFSTARELVANLVGVANNSAPADAPGLYGSAIKAAVEALPPSAAAAVTKAVLEFAARKADVSLSELAQAAFTAAAAGQTSEAKRLVKSLDKWDELLGAPGRPLIANADRLKAGVDAALEGAAKSPSVKASAPRVWVVKRGGSYVAALPGTTVEKLPGLAAVFALKLEALAPAPLSDAYRAYAKSPGVLSAVRARVAMGESVPYAALSTGWLWLKYLVMRAWSALTSWLPGRGLQGAEAAKSLTDAVALGEAAARAAGEPRLTVARARGAISLARRAAVSHEALTGRSGAVARVDSLSAEFEAGVKREALSSADRLSRGLETIVSGDGGLSHWASRYASDAREAGGLKFLKPRASGTVLVLGGGPGALAATTLAAASKDFSYTAFGDAVWAAGSGAYGPATLTADLRSTESGGSIIVETEQGDEKLASRLDDLGFLVTRRGRGLRAKLDAETVSADAAEMTELAAGGALLITGGSTGPAPVATGLDRLLADMKRSPKDAAKTAAGLDGRSWMSRAKTVGWVGDFEAVSTELRAKGVRVIALRDPATGLSKFARIEPLHFK